MNVRGRMLLTLVLERHRTDAPFLFGYAKPAPVNFRALHHLRRDTVLVAAAGPGMNLVLASVAALAFHLVGYMPASAAQWMLENLKNALVINVILAVLVPIPPLDGGRIAVGELPKPLAAPLSQLEPYGLVILIGLIFVLLLIGAQFGIDLERAHSSDHECGYCHCLRHPAGNRKLVRTMNFPAI